MLNLGLTHLQTMDLYDVLRNSHLMRVRLSVLDLDHRYIGDMSRSLLTGAVQIDTTSGITRSMNLQLLDTSRSIQLAPDDPDEGAAYPSRMVQATYMVSRPGSRTWYSIPTFTGPVDKAERDGAVLNLACLGKESLSNSSLWTAKTYRKGWRKTDLIRSIMGGLAGETKFDLPTTRAVTGTQTVLKRGDKSPWEWTKQIAASMGMHAFYDGRGYLRVRSRPVHPVWTFNDYWISDDPQISFDLEGFYNAVEVTGYTPKGKKKPISAKVVAPASHPLSPTALGRGGVPRYLPRIESNTDLKSVAACKDYAEKLLRQGLLQGVTATFPAKVVPFLEEFDLLSVSPSAFDSSSYLTNATIPLIAGEYMSLGYNKPVKPSRLSRRLRRT